MTDSQLLADHVWVQLDPRAGRLSRRGRYGVLAVVVAAVAALGLAVVAAVTGAIAPRVSGEMDEARWKSAQHAFAVRVQVSNEGSAPVHVRALTADDSRYEITAQPAPFVLAGHSTREVRLTLRVRSCAGETSVGPASIGISVAHWWGRRDYALTTDDMLLTLLQANACRRQQS